MPASLFPMFLKLEGRSCLVVGAGAIAASKILSLLESGARVTVVAPWASDELRKLAGDGKFRWLARAYEDRDLDGVFLVIAATSDGTVNRAVFLESQRLGILCNAVDDPPHCDFYFPAVVRRGDLQIAISTAGQSPALAQRLRRELEEVFDESAGDWVSDLGRRRREILATYAASEERKQWLVELAYSERPGLKRADAQVGEFKTAPVEAREVKS
jgi:precorrin-2 dehydrogenase/sirohydrochlorin ferrochelatase